jgi:glycosyltransferase involved in cell wall biosynthesis
MRILIVTDAWHPQVNGVVRTLTTLQSHLKAAGHEAIAITPDMFRTVPCPTYPEIRLALFPARRMAKVIESFQPCVVHIATEGPIGLAARRYCVKRGMPFTTAFHTKFPEYVEARFRIPHAWTYKVVRWFHAPSRSIMVATQTIEDELKQWGFENIKRWSRGVDTTLFRPRDKSFLNLPRPISLYVGRVAHYAAADVFVFPSLTDTFGLVLLEALASGVPVAAYPVPGPLDVIGNAPVGCLNDDLGTAVRKALMADPMACRAHAERFSWEASVHQFVSNIHAFPAENFFPRSEAPSEPLAEAPAAG